MPETEESPPHDVAEEVDSLTARGSVVFRLSDSLVARGDRLAWRRTTGVLRVDGSPAAFELGTTRIETEWVEFDPVLQLLVATGRGRVLGQEQKVGAAPNESWALDYLSISTMIELDSVILVIQEPFFRTPQMQSARAGPSCG